MPNMLDRLTGACCTRQTAIRAAKTLKAPPGQPLARFCGCFSCFAQAPPGRVAAGMLQRRSLFPRCAARDIGGCAAGRSFAGGLQRRVLAARCAVQGLVAARRGEVPLACCSGWCFQRFTPRGVLRWCGARGALRPLFLLRSCAADQEKRPEKKSWALMGCASIRPERLRETCIRSAPRCISRGQRKKVFFWLRGKGLGMVWGGGFALRSEVPCCVAPKGGPVFRDRNGRCGLLQNSHLGGFAARCALRAALWRARGRPRSPNTPAPTGAKTFLLGGFSFPSAFEMRKEKPRSRPPYGCFCPIGGCPPRKNKSAWLLFWVLFFAGGDTPRKKSIRSAPRVP